jgi:hypothetical protein
MRVRRDLPASLAAKEPAVRKNGRCVVCGRERPLVAVTNRDPFCSTGCSRKYHGVTDTWVPNSGDGKDSD